MPATYEPIATTTLSSAAANITFSSIPNTYTDLRIIVISNKNIAMQFNSDTSSNYSDTSFYGDGSTIGNNRDTSVTLIYCYGSGTSTSSLQIMTKIDIFSYTGSTNKTVLFDQSSDLNGSGKKQIGVGLWRSTAQISTIKLFDAGSANFAIGTTATLFGIKAA